MDAAGALKCVAQICSLAASATIAAVSLGLFECGASSWRSGNPSTFSAWLQIAQRAARTASCRCPSAPGCLRCTSMASSSCPGAAQTLDSRMRLYTRTAIDKHASNRCSLPKLRRTTAPSCCVQPQPVFLHLTNLSASMPTGAEAMSSAWSRRTSSYDICGALLPCSNRRDIWSGSDMEGAGRLRAEWNLRLLEQVY